MFTILITFFYILTAFSIGLSTVPQGIAGTIVIYAVSSLSDFYFSFEFWDYAAFYLNFVLLRSLGYLVKVYGRKLLNWCTFNKVHSFVNLLVHSLDLGVYLFVVYVMSSSFMYLFYIFVHVTNLWVFICLTFLLAPIFIIGGFVIVYGVLDLLSYFLFGLPLGFSKPLRLVSLLKNHLYSSFKNVENFVKNVKNIETLIVYITSIIVFAFISTLRLPVEIIALITNDGDNERKINFFWTKFVLGYLFSVFHLLNLIALMKACAMLLSFEVVLTVIYLSFKYQNEGFVAVVNFIVLQLLYIFGLVPRSVFTYFSVAFKKVYLTIRRDMLIFTSNFKVVIFNSVTGRPMLFSADTNIDQLNLEELNNLFLRTVERDFLKVLPFLALAFFFLLARLFFIISERVIRPILLLPIRIFECCMIFVFFFIVPDPIYEIGYFALFEFIKQFQPMLRFLHTYLRAFNLTLIYGVLWFDDQSNPPLRSAADYAAQTRLNTLFVRTWVNMTRRSVLKFVEFIDNVRLPEMMQAAYRPPSLDSLRSTYAFLHDIGFPVDQSFIDSLSRPENSSYLAEWGSWRNWLLGTSDFKLGFSKVAVGVRNFLPHDFFPQYPGYLYTTGFTGVAEEIRSTARYWTGNDKVELTSSEFSDLVDDTWEAVKAQYAGSRLASFDYIWKNWVKKYNMGFGFGYRTATGRLKQFTRQQVIDIVGGKQAFKRLWNKVFYNYRTLVMPSPVFTKWESLKLSKALSRSVRTVVGSAFVHSVGTYIFNYIPNHNYKPWETPSKVGMPINGQNFNRLWVSLTGYSKVWAGDMTAFDSSQPPPLLRVCQEIRKRGYTLHKDYHKICELIDISYSMLIDQPLAFKNFGDIAVKSQGATTGHTSTTPDNTIMLIANYLFAWRAITGLRAREFFNFNTLANFGDDHVLAYDEVYGWSPEKAVHAMAKLGTQMRDEAPGQTWLPVPGAPLPNGVKSWKDAKFSFLSKMPLPIAEVKDELLAAGITLDLAFGTCHDRSRLIGKISGETVKRKLAPKPLYESLIGFMELCAHHHDIYEALAKRSISVYNRYLHEVKKSGQDPSKIRRPPSYNEVLRKWYSKGVSDPDMVPEQEEHLDSIMVYDSPDMFGVFVRWLSDAPTILSPRYRNVRWADWIQNKLVADLRWPLEFIAASNFIVGDHATVRYLAAKTPYSFLRSDLLVPSADPPPAGVLYLRHYCYMVYLRLVNYRRAFNPLDLIRLLDSVFINIYFILTGRVTQSVVELDLHILDTLVVFLLSKINISIPPLLFEYFLPTPSDFFARFITGLISHVTPAGSIDFQSLDARVDLLRTDPGYSFVLDAPTGTGKSTRMVNRIQNRFNAPVVVVVPRQAVAISVGMYMRSLYPNSGIYIGAEGHRIEKDYRIVYTTVQSFFLNPRLRDPNNVFILDEAHINEPHYIVARNWFRQDNIRKIYMTATPGDLFPNVHLLAVPAINQFSVLENKTSVPNLQDYLRACIAFANDRADIENILIFVPTLEQMDYLSDRIHHKICRLSSKHRHIDYSASVFLSTSVADAGVTIPDVSFVLSPDINIAVSTLDTGVVTYYYKLSKLTLTQRKGRTGRTSNGAFLLYEIKETPVSDLKFSTADFVTGLAPASEQAQPFFPQHINETLTTQQIAALPYWGIKFKTHTWKSFNDFINKFSKYSADQFKAMVKQILEPVGHTGTGDIWRYNIPVDPTLDPIADFYGGTGPPFEEFNVLENIPEMNMVIYQKPNGENLVTIADKADPFHQIYSTPAGQTDPPYVPPKKPLPYTNTPLQVVDARPHTRQDVSGRGLLCGVRALIGLIYTLYGVRRSEDLVRQQMIDYTDNAELQQAIQHDPEGGHAIMLGGQMFGIQVLRDLAFDFYHIRVRMVVNGSTWQDPERFSVGDAVNYPIGTVYLDGAHYNYLGVMYTRAPIDDETPLNMA